MSRREFFAELKRRGIFFDRAEAHVPHAGRGIWCVRVYGIDGRWFDACRPKLEAQARAYLERFNRWGLEAQPAPADWRSIDGTSHTWTRGGWSLCGRWLRPEENRRSLRRCEHCRQVLAQFEKVKEYHNEASHGHDDDGRQSRRGLQDADLR